MKNWEQCLLKTMGLMKIPCCHPFQIISTLFKLKISQNLWKIIQKVNINLNWYLLYQSTAKWKRKWNISLWCPPLLFCTVRLQKHHTSFKQSSLCLQHPSCFSLDFVYKSIHNILSLGKFEILTLKFAFSFSTIW